MNTDLADVKNQESCNCKVCGKTKKRSIQPNPQQSIVCTACTKFFRRFARRLATATSTSKERLLACGCDQKLSLEIQQQRNAAPSTSLGNKEKDKSGMANEPLSRKIPTCRACRYALCCQSGLFDASDETKKASIDYSRIPCPVCAKPSTGFHFGTVCCRGCKMFFARSARGQTHLKYVCRKRIQKMTNNYPCYSGSDANDGNFGSCKLCRYQKCLSIGMSESSSRVGRYSHQFRAQLRSSGKNKITMEQISNYERSEMSKEESETESTENESSCQFSANYEVNSPVTSNKASCDSPSVDEPQSSAEQATSSSREMVVAQMKSPVGMSSNLWLYTNSANQSLNMELPEELKSFWQSRNDLSRYLLAQPAPIPLFQQLCLPEAQRTEWLISRLVQSTRVIDNMRQISSVPPPSLSRADLFSSTILEYLLSSVRYVLQFVKTLPGYDVLCVEDRTLLFTESVFQIMAAQWSLEYDERTGRLRTFLGLDTNDATSLNVLRNAFSRLEATENFVTTIGMEFTRSNMSIVEYSLIIALTFFNHCVTGLKDVSTVSNIRDEYLRTRDIFIHQQSLNVSLEAMTTVPYATARLNTLNQHSERLQQFKEFAFLHMVEFSIVFPELVKTTNPLFTELTQKIIQQSKN